MHLQRVGILCVLVGATACGPIEYVSQVTRRASSAVAAAQAAGAAKRAPYEYTAAVLYLHKSREEAGYADYQAAIRFGKRARELAERAEELALERRDDPDAAAKDGEAPGAPAPRPNPRGPSR